MATASSTHTQSLRRLHYMYGAVTQIELKNFLDLSSVDSEERKREIRGAWPAAAERFEALRRSEGGLAETISIRQLSTEDATRRVEELRVDPLFVSTFANYPYSFGEVEIDKLIACQRTVHRDYVRRITAEYDRLGRDLVQFCLIPGQDVTPLNIGRTAQNAYTVSSENPGLRFLGAYEQPYRPGVLHGETPGGQPVHLIALVLGYGGSTANAYRVGSRIILNNGFHRLYALRSLGITHAPLVIQSITHPELELPQIIAELPRTYLVESPRPALMKDFFDEQLNCEVTQRNFLKAIQCGWGISESMVPR
jgi:hypothetical protein